jgi:protein-tyrosine phosphatase
MTKQTINLYDEPDYSDFSPKDLWTEVLPNLWIGGTDDDDILGRGEVEPRITLENFDTVVTLHAWSNPADWGVKELRYAFHDGEVKDFDPAELKFLVDAIFFDWQREKRVLVRCLAGLNRSALVVTMFLMHIGYGAQEAIDLLRGLRSKWVLHNENFENWLLEVAERDGKNE